ncbi:TP901 family phage tail tape measure protein [Rhizobium sp. PP-F2F-G48]|uniref:phage tail tape measure protein n=1 Tax=Rhizobium sp. PP-F2F-G48 TaxID=2135651 RepID=UPI001044E37D|nr:phage tail tape measure protein [Rhizobium sp. PP-F2F-G48]TCM56153.1 TP901 family phage tail tape measure protein [Rhizobium sp. PP-F2F-G48]
MASAVIGALRVNLGIDTAEFWDGLDKAQRALGKVGNSLKSAGRDMSTYVSAPLAAMGALTLKTAGDFEASMNRVQAATNASTSEFDAMQKMALDLGANTSKSASESADMMEMLAKNGLTATQILDGAAAASIKLSEATGGDLSTSADVATNVMAQFKIEAKDLGRVVDGITNVTLASQFGFSDYKDAIAQAGGVAGALGVTFEDFNAAIAGTSSVFNSGSDAGTSFKTFLTTLSPKSKAAAHAMKELGLEFFNADGSMKSMAAVAEELKTSLSGLSDEAKTDAVTTIFGSDAMRTALALADQGAAGIDKLAIAIERKGSADAQAAARMKGFNGELEKLGGALETLAINIANSGLLAFVTGIVSKLADLVSGLSETNPQLLNWGVVVAAVAAALGPLLVTLGLVATGIAAVGAPVAAGIAAFAALAAGAAALYQSWDLIKVSFPATAAVVEGAIAVIQTTVVGLATQLGLVGQYLGQFLTGDLKGAGDTARLIFENLGVMFTNIANVVFPGALDAIKAKIGELVSSLVGFGQSMLATFQAIPEQMRAIGEQIIAVFAALPARMLEIGGQIIAGLADGIAAGASRVVDAASTVATQAYNKITGIFDINSPSRVMHEVGTFVTQGLANGIAAGTPSAKAAAGRAANEVSAALGAIGKTKANPLSGLKVATSGATQELTAMQKAGQELSSTLGSAFSGLIDGSKSLKDSLKDMLSQLGEAAFNEGLKALLGAFGGGSASGGTGGTAGSAGVGIGSLLGSAFKGLFGFANGGSFEVGGAGGIDSQLVAFKASPNERVSITKPGQERSGGGDSYRGGDIVIQGDASENTVRLIRGALQQYDAMAMERQASTWRRSET